MKQPRVYRTLDATKIVSTIEQLQARIVARFPNSGLGRVCTELRVVAQETTARVEVIGERNWFLRVLVAVLLAACIWLLSVLGGLIDFSKTNADSVYSILQGIEATMNIFVLMGAMVLFLVKVEERVKRKRALQALHELRSIAHVIDMHQLPKDPSSDRPPTVAVGIEPDLPQRIISNFELARYLDYCSEMLSLTAKVAALYAQSFPDPVVTDAVSDLERVTTNMSQKIWQKISLVQLQQQPAPPKAIS
jgi:hypothetical protein